MVQNIIDIYLHNYRGICWHLFGGGLSFFCWQYDSIRCFFILFFTLCSGYTLMVRQMFILFHCCRWQETLFDQFASRFFFPTIFWIPTKWIKRSPFEFYLSKIYDLTFSIQFLVVSYCSIFQSDALKYKIFHWKAMKCCRKNLDSS